MKPLILLPIFFIFITLIGCTTSTLQKKSKGKILIVASNRIHMGDPEKHDARNNLWEFAPPYHVFLLHRYEVDFVSPSGGKVHFSMNPMGISRYTMEYEGFSDKNRSNFVSRSN